MILCCISCDEKINYWTSRYPSTISGDILKTMNSTAASSDQSNNNGRAVVDPVSGEAPMPAKCDRFRISKVPTDEELQTINVAIDVTDGDNAVPPVGDDVLTDGGKIFDADIGMTFLLLFVEK